MAALSFTLRLSWLLALSITLTRGDPTSDMMDKFKNNIADAVADALLAEFKLGASGRIDNYSDYDLRLIRCDNDRGGMVQPFPSRVKPDESKLFSGFGISDKKIPIADGEIKKAEKTAEGVVVLCTGTAGKLQQRCDYAIFKKNPTDPNKPNLQGLITLEFTVSKSKPKIRANVCSNADKKKCDGKDSYTLSTNTEDDLNPVRFCSHPDEDICVEALISNGDKVNLYYHIYPRKYQNLSPKMKEMFSTAYEWCNFLLTAKFFTTKDSKDANQEFIDCKKGADKHFKLL